MRFLPLLVVSALLAGCSTPTTPDGNGGTPKVTNYSGFVAATGASARSGRLDLISTSGSATATGSITLDSGAPIALTGSYTSGSKTFALQGGGYQFTATVSADSQVVGTGTLTVPSATAMPAGPIALSPPALITIPIGVTGMVTTMSSPTVGFRGSYSGLYVAGLNSETERGDFYFVIQGTPYVTNRYRVSGWAPTSGQTSPGEPTQIQLEGTATLLTGDTPSNVRIGGSVEIRMVGTSDGQVNGAMTNAGLTIYGTYNATFPPGYSTGTWRVERYF